jgi:hypothetical protein
MRKLKLLTILLVLLTAGVCKASNSKLPALNLHAQADSLNIYTGKYQMIQGKGTFYVIVNVVEGQLVANATWDGSKLLLKHLTGDSFIVSGLDWSIKFIRDKDKNIAQMLVRGTDYWTKMKPGE